MDCLKLGSSAGVFSGSSSRAAPLFALCGAETA